MKHLQATTRVPAIPAKASLLQTQQKIALLSTFADALSALGDAIGTFAGLRQQD